MTVDNAANMLDLRRHQVFRLLKRHRKDGASAIRHKARGKTPINRINHAKRDYALSLFKEDCADFGPTFAAKMLAEHEGFKVSRETERNGYKRTGRRSPGVPSKWKHVIETTCRASIGGSYGEQQLTLTGR